MSLINIIWLQKAEPEIREMLNCLIYKQKRENWKLHGKYWDIKEKCF